MDKETFVRTYLPFATKAGQRFSMNPAIILAQAALESGWGSSYSARVRKNYFGITAYGRPNLYWDGSFSVSKNSLKLKFREYKTIQDSFYDFARLISSKYSTAHAQSSNAEAYAQAIAYSPYISENNGDNREGYRKGILSTFNSIIAILKKNSSKSCPGMASDLPSSSDS